MRKFKRIAKERCVKIGGHTCYTWFALDLLPGGKYEAGIDQLCVYGDASKQGILAVCQDFDPLRAMEKAQGQILSTGILGGRETDETDLLWDEVKTDLGKQLGFSLY
jgi:hypothetical protein